MTKLSRKLSLQIANANTTTEVDKWIGCVKKEIMGASWKYVGGVANNRGCAELSTNTAWPVLEKCTNCMDAILEWLKCLNPNSCPQSPRQAAERWLGPNPSAKLFRVGMLEGDSERRPTLSFRDYGIGQNPDRFIHTFLSIHASNKQNKPWLHGRYNMGGMAAYKFASRTVFISKRHEAAGDSTKEIGCTVVLRDTSNSLWPFVYLADKNGDTITLDLEDWEAGTEVRLVSYELPDHCQRVNQQTQSLRHLFMSAFPNPTIPFSVEELRPRMLNTESGKANKGLKAIGGLLQQLNGTIGGKKTPDAIPICLYSHRSTLKIPNPEGAPAHANSVELHVRVLDEQAGKNKDYYTQSANQVIFSLNGQRQMSLSRDWVKTATQFHHIAHRIICVADCSGLSEHARTALFSSTRESGTLGEYYDLFVGKVREDLKKDEFLQQIESDARDKSKKDALHTATDKIKEQLLRDISGVLGGKGELMLNPAPTPRNRRSTNDSHLADTPTMIKIENNPVNAKVGKTAHITLEVDAKNGYFPAYGRDIEVISQSLGKIPDVQHGTLLGGVLRVSFDLPESTPVGDHDILVSLRDAPANQIFSDRGTLCVSLPGQAAPKNKRGRGNERGEGVKGGPNINWVFHGKETWEDYGWNEESVGSCNIDKDDEGRISSILFYLNKDFKELAPLVEAKNTSKQCVQNLLDEYGLAVCPQLFGIAEFKESRSESTLEQEKRWVARGILRSISHKARFTVEEDVTADEPQTPRSNPSLEAECDATERFKASGGVIDTGF
jgi:hypothetical protein